MQSRRLLSRTNRVGQRNKHQAIFATGRPPDEAANRPPDRVKRRRLLVRRGFEWYEDQLAALKRLSLQEQLEGKEGSMSAMVREALDDYLKKRSAKP
jgi:hypothetical protein